MRVPLRSRQTAARGLVGLALSGALIGARVSVLEARYEHRDPVAQAILQTVEAGSLPATHGAPPDGTWISHGRVLSDIGSTDEPVGTQLTRRWTIYEHCDPVACRPWLWRESSAGFEEAPLVRAGDAYRAVFDVAEQGCTSPPTGPSGLERVFVVSVDASRRRLHAAEVTAGAYQGCGRGGRLGMLISTLRWDADYRSSSCRATVVCRLHVGGSAPGRGRLIVEPRLRENRSEL